MYDESMFHYNVQRVYIDDHNVPKLQYVFIVSSDETHCFCCCCLLPVMHFH